MNNAKLFLSIMRKLIDFAKEYAIDKKINRFELNYWNKNMNVGEFFRNQGFSTYNERMFTEL